ncbi:hypothetical protein O181_061450 [Austropuccinia psidii MF-1]|uniref:Integrase catalytic domain-containing protein n=1 Tax=Austropuccinia psidii MF-1 TaxID=1389203 RepID=A0A9Q3EME5_9BASI|nr:hypothetical protein [Austropuccinia psidii MF-1]
MIQTLEDMIRGFCAFGLEFKGSDGFTHDWCTLIPALELAYKTSVHSSTGKTPAMLEKGWNPRLPADTLRKELVDIHPTASSFNIMLDKVKHHANQNMDDTFDFAKEKWDKSHKVPDFKAFLYCCLTWNQCSSSGIEGELENKHPNFPVSLLIPYQPADKELFPLRNPTPLSVPPVDQSEDQNIKKVIKERRLRGKNKREYLSSYRNPVHEDEWLAESDTPDSDKRLRRFRHERSPQA